MLVSTDVAAMGLDVSDLNLAINIGIETNYLTSIFIPSLQGLPKSAWKIKQQQGRVGRNGMPAMDITLLFPQRGQNPI